jgi:hypothetical protein
MYCRHEQVILASETGHSMWRAGRNAVVLVEAGTGTRTVDEEAMYYL